MGAKLLSVMACGIALLSGCGSDGWTHKASGSVKQASDIVGGFSDDDRRLYQLGLQHIAHQHQKPGQFTIQTVVDEEKARESQRADIVKQSADSQQKAATSARIKTAYGCYDSQVLAKLNASDEGRIVTGRSFNGANIVSVDGDKFEYMSQQDQHRLSTILVNGLSMCLRDSGMKEDEVDTRNRMVIVQNLAGDEISHGFASW